MKKNNTLTTILAASLLTLAGTQQSKAGPKVTIAWNPNLELDLAGYRIYYGFQSGVYTGSVNVGNNTTHTLELENDKKYFTVVTAYNTSDLESDYSNEISFTTAKNLPKTPTGFHKLGSFYQNDTNKFWKFNSKKENLVYTSVEKSA